MLGTSYKQFSQMVVKKGDESHGRIRKESPTKQLKDS